MAALICLGCTAVYSVGAPACPQCGSTEHQEDSVPHITVHGGPSDAGPGPDSGLDPVDVPAGVATGDGSLDPVDVPEGTPAGDGSQDQGGAAALSAARPAKKSLKDQLAG